MKYHKPGGFVCFDPNDVNVSKFTYERTKLLLMEREKSVESNVKTNISD